jgi:hypothetical protein
MYLEVCEGCSHHTIKEGNSHCGKEACYSYLAKCIQRKALAEFLARHGSVEGAEERVA